MDKQDMADRIIKHWFGYEQLKGLKTENGIKRSRDAIIKRLEDFSEAELIGSVDNYAKLLDENNRGFFWYSYSHRLYDFFRDGKRKSAPYENFLAENKPLQNYAYKKYRELFND